MLADTILEKYSNNKTHSSLVDSLNTILANEFTLFTKTLNYHWNLTGSRFHSLHLFLEEQYQQLLEIMDNLAERIRILDYHPISTLTEVNNNSTLIEDKKKEISSFKMLENLSKSHLKLIDDINSVIKTNRNTIDLGSEDFLVNILSKHEKMNWMISSHLIENNN